MTTPTNTLPATQTAAGTAQDAPESGSEGSGGSWLERLKVGDTVVLATYRGKGDRYLYPIEKATDEEVSIFIGCSECRYIRETGYGIESTNLHQIEPVTPEIVEQIRRRNTRNKIADRLKYVKWKEHSLDTLAAIVALIEAESSSSTTTTK